MAQELSLGEQDDPQITMQEFIGLLESVLRKGKPSEECTHTRVRRNGGNLPFDSQALVTPGGAAMILMCIWGERYKTKQEALQALATRIIVPKRRKELDEPLTKSQARTLVDRVKAKGLFMGSLSRRRIQQLTLRRRRWVQFQNEKFGFAIRHPLDMRVEFDPTSNALRFQRREDGVWKIEWTVWRNLRDIEKWSTIDGVISDIHPDGLRGDEERTVKRETVYIDKHSASFVTVEVNLHGEKPWVYRIVFLDLCDRTYEISAHTSTLPGFERFFRSFRLLEPISCNPVTQGGKAARSTP